MSIVTSSSAGEKLKREDYVTFFNVNITSADENGIVYDEENPTWVPFGEDNDELTRTMNNEVDSKKNVLGFTSTDASAGVNETEIDPVAIRKNDVLSQILYTMYKYNLVGDKCKLQCMDVNTCDTQDDGSYGAFTETAIADLTSWGGDTTKLNGPMKLVWMNDKVHGTFDASTSTFTATTSA